MVVVATGRSGGYSAIRSRFLSSHVARGLFLPRSWASTTLPVIFS
jgi:hypothetical protein